jgi:hypothetical protein
MFKFLNAILPDFAKKSSVRLSRSLFKAHWENLDKDLTKYELSERHIKNLTALTNREEMLKLLPKNGVVAELGVDEGSFSQKIIEISCPKKLFLVDVWGSARYNKMKQEQVEKLFSDELAIGKVEICLGFSTEVVKNFNEELFDWIYIDTDHSYKTTIAELESYRTKLKANGIIAGHDFRIGNWNGMVRYGVIEAVYEFCVKYDWELIYITMENVDFPSFAIRKIEA